MNGAESTGEKDIVRKVEFIALGPGTSNEKLLRICVMLEEEVEHYNWIGFYLVDKEDDRMLVLGPYVGAPTDHTRIPFGRGICGQAAQTGKLFLVQDVTAEDNYLSCSPDVRSEIVLPIFKGERMVGELDIDSHIQSPFTDDDIEVLTRICELVASIL